MREEYIRRYKNDLLLRGSLSLLASHCTWLSGEKITLTPYGYFFLSPNNAPFLFTLVRIADRCLYHSANAWRFLIADLDLPQHAIDLLRDADTADGTGCLVTGDTSSKYEIEAFITALSTLYEANFIGKASRLEKSVVLGQDLRDSIFKLIRDFQDSMIQNKWQAIRNCSAHVKDGLIDSHGIAATIHLLDDTYDVQLKDVFYVEGLTSDNLVKIFDEVNLLFQTLILNIRNLFLSYAFEYLARPINSTHLGIQDPLGNIMVILGKDGFEHRIFPIPSNS